MKYLIAFLLCLSFVCISNMQHVIAHGTGVSYEESKDGYKIDIGHDEFIAALESTRFDFALYPLDISNVEGEVFTDAWVTLVKDKKLYFGGAVAKPEFGATGFTFVFPEAGTYTVSARFQKDGETVTKTEFPLVVIAPLPAESPRKIQPWMSYVLFGIIGLCIGVACGLLASKRKKIV